MVKNLPPNFGYQTDLLCKSHRTSSELRAVSDVIIAPETQKPVVIDNDVSNIARKDTNNLSENVVNSILSSISIEDKSKHLKKVSNLLNEYAELHKSSTKEYSASTKYLLLKPRLAMGLGNKLEGVVSTLILAILTKRIILFEVSN